MQLEELLREISPVKMISVFSIQTSLFLDTFPHDFFFFFFQNVKILLFQQTPLPTKTIPISSIIKHISLHFYQFLKSQLIPHCCPRVSHFYELLLSVPLIGHNFYAALYCYFRFSLYAYQYIQQSLTKGLEKSRKTGTRLMSLILCSIQCCMQIIHIYFNFISILDYSFL